MHGLLIIEANEMKERGFSVVKRGTELSEMAVRQKK